MKTRIPLILFMLLCAAITGVQSVHATTITVMNTNDSGIGSLRQALADAADGDAINFDASVTGTITLTTGQLIVDKSVTISGPGAANLAVDGNGAGRVFLVVGGTTATISDLTITNGHANDFGGGIYNSHANLTMDNCTVSGNSAGIGGGGIYNDGSNGGSATLSVTNGTLSGNSAQTGGGIYNNGFDGSAMLSITNSTLSSDSATNFGGAVFNEGELGSATAVINNSTLSGNSTEVRGGGVYNDAVAGGSVTLSVTDSTLSGNSAGIGGGGIYNNGSNGGSATLMLGDTIFNAGASGANIANDSGTVTSLGYNLSSDDASAFLNQTGDQNSSDPMLGPLQDNGGPTFTHALLIGSPAIDMGDPSFTPPPDYDQRGAGYPRVVNSRIDIGAFEAQIYAAQVQPPINADGTSVFSVRRGVVPVKFTLTLNGEPTCDLPPATIAVTRTGGGTTGDVDESIYSGPADTGSNFRIDSCQYVYNLSASAMGVGTYRVHIMIDGQVVGSATFGLQ